jgi:colanic acid biosynthesis glycosyl transferase WcaI
LLSILKRTSFVFHVQDLQPDAAANLGMLEGQSSILSALRKLEQFAYEKASRVSAITPGMLRNISAKGIPSTKLILFPNGVELPEFWRLPDKNQFRKLHGFSEADFLVTYSGNLGRKQGLDQLLQVAALTREPRIRFVICGDGAERDQLQAAAAELRLQNLTFLPLQPEVRYRELLVDTDISVVPQQSHGGSCFFPSKLLKILAFSSPVLALTDPGTELDRAVAEGGFGVRFRPDEPGEIADFLERLSHNPDSLKDWGREGFKFVKRFEQAAVLLAYTGELEQFEPGPSAASREAGCCADKQTSPESAALQNHPAIPPA